MSRATASLFERMSLDLFSSSRQRRVKRHQRRSAAANAETQMASVADVALEQRLLLSAVTVSTDMIVASDVLVSSVDELDPAADVLTVNDGVRVESTTGSVTLNAGDDLNIGVGSTIAAVSSVNLNLDVADADTGAGSTATLQNVFAGTVVNITGGPDNDSVVLSPSSFDDVPMSVDLAAGAANLLEVDLTGVVDPILTYVGSSDGTITSTSHETITFTNVQSVTVSAGTGTFDQVVVSLNDLTDGNDASKDTTSVSLSGANIVLNVNGSQLVSFPQVNTSAITISGSSDPDEFQIDHSSGLITVPINVTGGAGDDLASVKGDSIESAVYTPDAATTGNGTVVVTNAGTLTFSGLEPVDIFNMATATLALPSANDILSISEGFDFASGTIPALVVSGTSAAVTIESVAFFNNGAVVVDTSTNDGTDTVTLNGANNGHGNSSLTIQTGGTDSDGDVLNLNGNATFANDFSVSGAAINLQDNVTISAGGTLSFGSGAVDGAFGLSLTGGDILLNGTVGGTTALTSLLIASSGNSLIGANISVSGAMTISNNAVLAGGIALAGAPVTFQGDVSPGGFGDDTEILTIANGLVLSDRTGDDLTLHVNGKTTAGVDYDQLVVSGDVTLDGRLNLVGMFTDTGAANDEIVLIANDGGNAVIGAFSNYSNGDIVTLNGQDWRLLYDGGDGNDVTLRFGSTTSVTVNDVMVTEGDSGTSVLTFTVTSTTAIGEAFRVTYATADNTAEAATDYTSTNSVVNFLGTASGESQTISIDVSGDDLVERHETLLLTLTNILDTTNATLTDGIGIGTITNDDTATLTIDSFTSPEGDSGSSSFVFTVSLDSDIDTAFTLDYATADNSATVADSDYLNASGTLNFTGVASDIQTISVQVNGDTTPEFDEVFDVLLSNLNTAGRDVSLASSSSAGTIIDDDRVPVELSLSAANGNEAGQTVITITAIAAEAVSGGQSVGIALTGTGISASDYSLSNPTIQIVDGETTGSITLTVADDGIVELTEVATVAFDNPSGGIRVGSVGSRLLSIASDDFAMLSIAAASVDEMDSGTATLTFDVTLDRTIDSAVTVDYATVEGTATSASGDYVAANGTLNFTGTSGEVQTISVVVSSDEIVELDEVFQGVLSNLNASGRPVSLGTSSATGTITNDDSATLSIADVSSLETDAGTTTFDFVVTLSAAVDIAVTAVPAATDSTATIADGDYSSLALQTLQFVGTAGEQQTVSVTVNGDRLVESDEAFQVMLASLQASGRAVSFADDTAVGTIMNDDSPVPVNLSASVLTGSESSATVITLTVTADEAVGGEQTVELVLVGVDGSDAELSSTTVTIPDGQTSGSVTLTVTNDNVVEAIETAVISFSNLSAGLTAGATSSAAISIVDDDAATISINDISIQEGAAGTTDFEFTLSLSALVDGVVNLNYATATSTALATDFTAASGVASFPALSMDSQSITVSVTADSTVELNEQFLVNLTGLSASGLNVTFADNQGRATIVNDDQATLSINDVGVSEGDAGTSVYSFNVTLSQDVDTAVSVDYSTTDGTAVAPTDYTAISSNTIAFSGSQGEIETIHVLVVAETVAEFDETFFLDLLTVNASGRDVVIDRGRGTGTIIDDDGIKVNLSSDVATGSETGTSIITLTATAASPVTGSQTLNLGISGDRVTSSDYTLSANVITIEDGATTGTVTFTVADDNVTEILETATATLSGFPEALSAGVTTSVDIALVDNDQTTLTISDVTITEVDSGSRTLAFVLVADNAVDVPFTVDYATADGTATTADSDYTAVAQTTLNFTGIAAQQLAFTVDVTGDQKVELDETVLLNLLNIQAGGRNVVLDRATATGTITNNDSATLAISDLRQVEGDSGGSVFAIDVTLTGDVDSAFTVDYRTVDGVATAGADFTAVAGSTLSFVGASGEVQTAVVTVLGDTDAERDEGFQLVLENLAGLAGRAVSIADGTSDIVVADDDGVEVNFGVSSNSGSEVAGTVITLVASAASQVASAETVDVVVTGTGIDGNDYVLSAGSITINAGQTIGTSTFTVLNDSFVENLETAVISFANPSIGLALGVVTSQSITITSEDEASLTIVDQAFVEGDSGSTAVLFTVMLSDAVTSGFTVDFATSDGTATTADSDYLSSSGTLTFAGTAFEVQTFTVGVIGDTINEADENYIVTLSNLVGAAMGINLPPAATTGTITNDDGTTEVNLSVSAASGSEVDQTVITITATAAQPVIGDQSVTVSLSGTGITSADYSIGSNTIVIPNGQTSGSVTLQVLNDADIEAATETATVAISSPTAGLILGATVSVDLSILDDSTVVLDVIDRFQTGQPTLTWQEVPGATGYEVWFSRVFPNVDVLEVDRNVTGTSWQVPGDLDSAMYRYWVRAKDADGDFTAWSAANQFEVRPDLISPLGGSFTRTPTFEWEAIPFASAYELYLSSSNGVERIANIVGTTYTPTEALPEGDVRWWIRAEEALGNRGWSAVGFASSDVKPVLLSPVGGTTDVSPTFNWSSVPGTGRYALFVQNLDTSEVVINDVNLTETSYTSETDLAAGSYRFWVKAIDAATDNFNSGLWSNSLDFMIAEMTESGDLDDQSSALLVRIDAGLTSLATEDAVETSRVVDRYADISGQNISGPVVVAAEHLNVQSRADASPESAVVASDRERRSTDNQQLIDAFMSASTEWLL